MEVDKHVLNLYEVLKAHSKNIDQSMTSLRKWKSKCERESSHPYNPLNWPLVSYLRGAVKKQQSSRASLLVPSTDSRYDQSSHSLDLEEIKSHIQIVETNISIVLKSMREHFEGIECKPGEHFEGTECKPLEHFEGIECKPGEHFEETECKRLEHFAGIECKPGEHFEEIECKPPPPPTIQVYDRDGDVASDFMTSEAMPMQIQLKMTHVENVEDIQKDKPLLVLCQLRSELEPDIDYAWENLTDVGDIRAATFVIHSREQHALPQTSSKYKLSDVGRYKDMCIIDAAFTEELKFYDCEMNSKAVLELEEFLKNGSAMSI